MKKSLFVGLALALGLSACTPAASETPTPSPVTETPAETAPAEEASPVVAGTLESIRDRSNTGTACYVYQPAPGEIRKLDYATARIETVYSFGEAGTVYSDVVVEPDALYAVTADTLYKIPLDGGEASTIALPGLPGGQSPSWCDDQALYIVAGNVYNPPDQNVACRIDLATGEITDLPLPYMVLDSGIYAAEGSRVLLRCCVPEQPLPSVEEREAFDAVLQNATSEYVWWDMNTGALEKVLEEPYEGTVDAEGNTSKLLFLGRTADRLYFQTIVYSTEQGNLPGEVVSYALDGSDKRTEWTFSETAGLFAMYKEGELYWLVDNSNARMQVYEVATGNIYDVGPGLQSEGYPLTFTEDDRVLVITKQDGKGTREYGLIPRTDYLAGSRDWTPVEDPDGQTVIVF